MDYNYACPLMSVSAIKPSGYLVLASGITAKAYLHLHKLSIRRYAVALLTVLAVQLSPVCAADQQGDTDTVRPKSNRAPYAYVGSGTDIKSDELSAEALQLAGQLHLLDKLKQIEQMRHQEGSFAVAKSTLEQRVQLLELKEEATSILEQTRMEVDYVRSALSTEEAIQSELIRAYTQQRDNRVFQNNLWSVRTNGILWTLAEALSIPTYSHPRYSITSGTLGILAGLVPTAFSIVALRGSQGERIDRQNLPSMLAKIFDYPVVPAVDYPQSVWEFLNSVPPRHKFGKTRIHILIDQWLEDRNVRILTSRNNKSQLDLLTGSVEHRLSIDLLSDRVIMLTQLDALVSLMNRPVLELMLVVRGGKHLPEGGSQ